MSGILFIDAEQPFSDQTASALRSRGFQVKQLDDGKDGLDYAAKDRPDLIVLCVELPKMSGYSICNKLKKDNDLKGIPLIITSKEATPETFAQHKKLKTRAEDYLIKPFSDADLVDKITALIPAPSATNGAAGPAAAAADDGMDALESLGADLDLGGAPLTPGGESEVRLDSDDLSSLDALDAPSPAPSTGPPPVLDDDMLSGLDQSFGGDNLDGLDSMGSASGGLDDLELPGSVKDDSMAGLDDALDSLSAEPEPAPAPAPAPAPIPARVAPPLPPPRPAVSVPPMAVTNQADLQALQQARRENGDLKSKVAELEARLRQAEEQAKQAASATSPPSSASSAREVLTLKQQLRAKDDEILQKEQAIVEVQEQLERHQQETQQKLADAGNKDIELSSLKARVQSLSDERDELETQMQGRLQQAESDAAQLRAALEQTQQQGQSDLDAANARAEEIQQQVEEARRSAERAKADGAARAKTLEGELKEKEQDAVKAYQRIKSEEAIRLKAREAAELVVKLLRGDVDMKPGVAELEL